MTLQEFIEANQVTMTVTPTDHNVNMEDTTMDHWAYVLRCGPRRMSGTFSMGSGHAGNEPELDDVLDCLASDAAGYENCPTFEEWASDYGYDTDSRKAEKIFHAVKRESKSLSHLLGDAYPTLLWDIERL